MHKYEMVAEHFRAAITAGEVRPGDRLPSLTKLCEQFDVCSNTIRGAMIVLKYEGLVVGRQGEGVFVDDRKPGTWVQADDGGGDLELCNTNGILVAYIWHDGGYWCGQVVGRTAHEPPMQTLAEMQRRLEAKTWVQPVQPADSTP